MLHALVKTAMMRLYAIAGVALIFSAISDLAFVALTCDGEKTPCTDFSVGHPVIGLFLGAGSALAGLAIFLSTDEHHPLR